MVGALTRTRAALSYAAKSLALGLSTAVVLTASMPAGSVGAAPITPITPIAPDHYWLRAECAPASTPPPARARPVRRWRGLPVCLPGQESAPVSGAGTPAPLGVLEGLPADLKAAGGTFAGIGLDAEQVTMAATIVAVGKQMGITRRGIEIAVAVATEQSSLRPEAINEDWLGLFQQNPVTYTQYRRTEPGGAAWMFYDQLIKQVPGYDTDPGRTTRSAMSSRRRPPASGSRSTRTCPRTSSAS